MLYTILEKPLTLESIIILEQKQDILISAGLKSPLNI